MTLYCSIFRNKILNHKHLFFIVIDSDNNVFGHYNEVVVSKIDKYIRDELSFMFTLNNNNRCGIKKFKLKSKKYDYSMCVYDVYENEYYYFCGNGNKDIYEYCQIRSIGNPYSSHICDMSKCYEGINKTDLIGRDPETNGITFTTKRLIVIEMK